MFKNFRFYWGMKLGNDQRLYPLNKLRNEFNLRTVKSDTQICIDGFQRCGNTYMNSVFRKFNKKTHVSNFLHSSINIIHALEMKIPVIVTIREPEDCLASLMSWDDRVSYSNVSHHYIKFYKNLLPYKDNCVVSDFKKMIKAPDLIIQSVNSKYGTSFKESQWTTDEIQNDLNRKSEDNETKGKNSAFPNAIKKITNTRHKEAILTSEAYAELKDIYLEFIA